MEFCPEVAVLQSAFQLVQTKAGRKLETVSKTECADYVHILQTTLEEICHGLENDLELQDQLLWQKNLHTLILYALVKKVYKPTEQREGIPILSPLDVLVQVLPKFSCHLYFELVKACSWEHHLICSLSYLELSVSQQLLEDLIQDSTQDPVTCGDVKIMNGLRDALMSNLLTVPFELDLVLEKWLKPLSKPDKCIPLPKENFDDYDKERVNASKIAGEGTTEIQAVNHEGQLSITQEQEKDKLVTEDVLNDSSGADQTCVITLHTNEQSTSALDRIDKMNMQADCQKTDDRLFWCNFLNKNSSFVTELLESIESQIEKSETSFDYLQCLAQLGLIGFIRNQNSKIWSWNRWLAFNMFHESDQFQANISAESMLELRPVYIMNNLLADQITSQISSDRWLGCLHKVLREGSEISQGIRQNLRSCYPKTVEAYNDMPTETHNSEIATVFPNDDSDINRNFLHVVAGLCVQKDVLHRMMQGCLDEIENVVTDGRSKLISECKDMMMTLLKSGDIKEITETTGDTLIDTADREEKIGLEPEITTTMKGVKYGDMWKSDVTLEALCWRIKYRLPFSQDCVEMLWDQSCNKFWLDESVYDTFSRDIQLLVEKGRVMRLSEILRTLEGKSREVTQKAQHLTCRAFTSLSFVDQDTVAMEMYVRDETLRGYLDFEEVQMMTVFNRITALRDDQILSELLLLCLCDPRDVLSTAVRMSVSNKDQARNFAQVLQFFPSICQTSHPTHHPDCSLLVDVIREFLHTTSLTDKEQTTFLVFLTTLWQVPFDEKKKLILSPLEMLHQVIFPFIGVDSLLSDGPITCKFALTMLKTVLLECGCNKLCDWSEFEPVALVLCLTELLQECVTFWDTDEAISGLSKINVKCLVQGCLKHVSKMFQDGILTPTEMALEWFTSSLSSFDLSVILQLHVVLASLGLEQCIQNYQEAVDLLSSSKDSNITSLLLIASIQPKMVQHATVQQTANPIDYDEILVALIQVLPNLLSSEFESTVRYVMSLIDQNGLSVPYRLAYMVQIPLTSIKEFQSVVGVSQILRDVIITLGFLSDRHDILHHVLQCYTACVKSLSITTSVYGTEVKLFIISQMFHHVCDVVQLLPQQTEPVLVLLLHLLTSFTDIHTKSDSMLQKQNWKRRMVDNITKDIQLSVGALPDNLVEKEMLMKKIKKVS